jgi:hypothetical protein
MLIAFLNWMHNLRKSPQPEGIFCLIDEAAGQRDG